MYLSVTAKKNEHKLTVFLGKTKNFYTKWTAIITSLFIDCGFTLTIIYNKAFTFPVVYNW